ncbi:RNA methyltransferase [Candidatus Binatia bacterium]|nr:RNA methyltransferase [Candidatus Binatia bacterium]
MAELFVVILHYPVIDKNGIVVTTAVTNMDIHDIARSARTYGVRAFFVATPTRPLRILAAKILEHWDTGFGGTYNVTRKEALELVSLEQDLDTTLLTVERLTGRRPCVVVTSARPGANRVSFATLRARLDTSDEPHLLVLGTGWGLAPEILARADLALEPISGPTDYNHLSVRAAAAIMLDRLRGAR